MGWVVSGARILAATALIPAVWFSTADAAQAATAKGITVPDVVFAQGSGEHAVDITIASTSAVVKSADTIEVYASSPYIVAVSGTAVGATCTDSSGTWACHASAWKAGAIRVTVGTSAADCAAFGVCKSPLEAHVEGSAGWLVQGSVEITPKPPVSQSPSPVQSVPSTAAAAVSSSASIRASSSGSAAPSASTDPNSASIPAPSDSATEPSATASDTALASGIAAGPGAPPAARVAGAHATSSSGAGAAFVLLACAALLVAGGFVAWGMIAAGRRRRAALAPEAAIQPEPAPAAAPWSAFESRPKARAAPAEPEPMPETGAPSGPEYGPE